jgi:ribose 5-phosphate isomerase A
MVVIADETKRVDMLGRFPLPIEVNRFGLAATGVAVLKAGQSLGLEGPIVLREAGGKPFVTDGGHLILDASFGRIPDPRALSSSLHAVPGVVEHGLFIGMADLAIVAGADGARTVAPRRGRSA